MKSTSKFQIQFPYVMHLQLYLSKRFFFNVNKKKSNIENKNKNFSNISIIHSIQMMQHICQTFNTYLSSLFTRFKIISKLHFAAKTTLNKAKGIIIYHFKRYHDWYLTQAFGRKKTRILFCENVWNFFNIFFRFFHKNLNFQNKKHLHHCHW